MQYNGTSLNIACKFGHVKCVNLLIDYGANMERGFWVSSTYPPSLQHLVSTIQGGMTPLMISCMEGHESCVRCLLMHGARSNSINAVGIHSIFRLIY